MATLISIFKNCVIPSGFVSAFIPFLESFHPFGIGKTQSKVYNLAIPSGLNLT